MFVSLLMLMILIPFFFLIFFILYKLFLFLKFLFIQFSLFISHFSFSLYNQTFIFFLKKVTAMFVEGAEIKPVSVSEVEFGNANNPTGKCFVSFRSEIHCDLAFKSIQGNDEVFKRKHTFFFSNTLIFICFLYI